MKRTNVQANPITDAISDVIVRKKGWYKTPEIAAILNKTYSPLHKAYVAYVDSLKATKSKVASSGAAALSKALSAIDRVHAPIETTISSERIDEATGDAETGTVRVASFVSKEFFDNLVSAFTAADLAGEIDIPHNSSPERLVVTVLSIHCKDKAMPACLAAEGLELEEGDKAYSNVFYGTSNPSKWLKFDKESGTIVPCGGKQGKREERKSSTTAADGGVRANRFKKGSR